MNPFFICHCFTNLSDIYFPRWCVLIFDNLNTFTMQSAVWSGNALHKVAKYFITSTKRDPNGKLELVISPASGRRKLSPTKEIIEQLKEGKIQLFVLTTQPDIAIDLPQKVLDNENRYVIDFDKRGIKWTMRDIPVFYDNLRDQLCVEIDKETYTLDQFFK